MPSQFNPVVSPRTRCSPMIYPYPVSVSITCAVFRPHCISGLFAVLGGLLVTTCPHLSDERSSPFRSVHSWRGDGGNPSLKHFSFKQSISSSRRPPSTFNGPRGLTVQDSDHHKLVETMRRYGRSPWGETLPWPAGGSLPAPDSGTGREHRARAPDAGNGRGHRDSVRRKDYALREEATSWGRSRRRRCDPRRGRTCRPPGSGSSARSYRRRRSRSRWQTDRRTGCPRRSRSRRRSWRRSS